MGHIAKITGKANLPTPEGWDVQKEQFNLPFTVELKENFHVHWQDIRIEMMPEDFDHFVESLVKAHEEWKKDGKPQELEHSKRYGWWPGEEGYDFDKDRDKKLNKNSKPCHHFKLFPRTESGNLNFDSICQIELQVNGQYHVHYKNFRIELGKNTFKEIANAMKKSADSVEKYNDLYLKYGKTKKKIRGIKNKYLKNPKGD